MPESDSPALSRPGVVEGAHGTVEASEAVSAPQDASQPGIYGIPAERYHEDPSERPSLSASIAHLLVNQTPLHAWAAHPKLNPDLVREEKAHFDIGTVAHSLILEGHAERVHVVEAGDWRKKEAQAERDWARAQDKIPLLEKDWERVQTMVAAIRAQLESWPEEGPPFFADGQPEQTLIWEEEGVTCRALVDWLRDDLLAIDDLKTTGRSANPVRWARGMYDIGADIQIAFHLRGVRALTGQSPLWRYVVVESQPPYALSVVSPPPDVLELGNAKVDRALEVWRKCVETGVWPAYPRRTFYPEVPAFEQMRWMEQDGEVVLG
jgi:hypothetical protein